MTEKECIDYGKDISPLYDTENPASYLSGSPVRFYVYHDFPPRLVPKNTAPEQKSEPRPVIIAQPKIEYNKYKRLPFWQSLIIILQKCVPRIDSI